MAERKLTIRKRISGGKPMRRHPFLGITMGVGVHEYRQRHLFPKSSWLSTFCLSEWSGRVEAEVLSLRVAFALSLMFKAQCMLIGEELSQRNNISETAILTVDSPAKIFRWWIRIVQSICSDNPQRSTLVPSVRDWREETLGMKILGLQTKQTKRNSVTQKPQITWSSLKGNSWSNH